VQQRFDTWQRGLRRAVCRIFGVFCSVVTVLQLRSLLAAHERTGAVDIVAVLGVATLVGGAWRGFRGRTDSKDAFLLSAVLAVSAADRAPIRDTAATGGDSNPAFFILAATLLAYIVVWRGPVVPLAMAAAAAVYGVCAVELGGRPFDPVLDETVLLVTSCGRGAFPSDLRERLGSTGRGRAEADHRGAAHPPRPRPVGAAAPERGRHP
jgi:hypothetical protein